MNILGKTGYLSEKITHTPGKNNLDWFHDIPLKGR